MRVASAHYRDRRKWARGSPVSCNQQEQLQQQRTPDKIARMREKSRALRESVYSVCVLLGVGAV